MCALKQALERGGRAEDQNQKVEEEYLPKEATGVMRIEHHTDRHSLQSFGTTSESDTLSHK